jgi:hypothetical protein
MGSHKTLAQIHKEQWYSELIDDCKTIIVETTFASRWALIEGYHKIGERILEDWEKFSKNNKKIIATVAKSVNRSERSVYYAVEFYRKFPDLNRLPEGKNTLWRDVVHKYLPQPKGAKEEKIEKDLFMVCPQCGHKFLK